jgi:hypothetical protein
MLLRETLRGFLFAPRSGVPPPGFGAARMGMRLRDRRPCHPMLLASKYLVKMDVMSDGEFGRMFYVEIN